MINKYKIRKKSEKGMALVEVIAGLGIAVIVITSLVSLSISTMRASLKSKLLLEGSKIANREIELVRAYRDDSDTWTSFFTIVSSCSSSPCHMETDGSGFNLATTTEGTGTEQITRSFTAIETPGGSGIVRISVSVTWKVGNDTHGAYIQTDLTNWRGK
jgi:Tfp pilus assembly protein PilV